MYDDHRQMQFEKYNRARTTLIDKPGYLLKLEEYFATFIKGLLETNLREIVSDYNEASYLYPFWQNYPPDERGREPRGDQVPWIEVGEHAIGDKLARLLSEQFRVRDVGLPAGSDKRFVLSGGDIEILTDGFTDSIWLFVDIKSVGPRDDSDHTVLSHNQVSGNGLWTDLNAGVMNTIITARGKNTHHAFYCSIPPVYVLSDGTVAPVVIMALKPVYRMLNRTASADATKKGKIVSSGQPLSRITVVVVPNGLLLMENPGYLNMNEYTNLFFPGKDDEKKNPRKKRSRIQFKLLRQIADWRVSDVSTE